MAFMQKRTFERKYVQVPNETAQAPELKNNEKPISLEALGLIVNLWAYDVEKWKLHKTELYKRFAYNKERSVKRAWNELIEAGYIVEFRYRSGKKWEYVYIYNVIPYTEEQRQIILEESREEYGEIRGLQNEDCKMQTSSCRPQNVELSNNKLKQDTTKEKLNKSNTKDFNSSLSKNDEMSKDQIDALKLFLKLKKYTQGEIREIIKGFKLRLKNNDELSKVTRLDIEHQLELMEGQDIKYRPTYFLNGLEMNIGKAEKEIIENEKRSCETKNKIPFNELYNWLNIEED